MKTRPWRFSTAGPSFTQKPMRSQASVGRLMHTGAVEVRLLRRGGVIDGEGQPDEFGVFQLERTDCAF